jgi:hypothetical protein
MDVGTEQGPVEFRLVFCSESMTLPILKVPVLSVEKFHFDKQFQMQVIDVSSK